MKNGKSSGIDNISNEMLKVLVDIHPQIVLKLFNAILQSGNIIPEWATGMIVPIFKKGSRSNPANYRGITLGSCLGKLFFAILNERFLKYAFDKNLLSTNQLGFVPGNRTTDAHIIINNLVKKVCHKKNSRIYSCFVDFQKAFDSVPRDILPKKLINLGIHGNFFNIIRILYTMDKACIKLDNQLATHLI